MTDNIDIERLNAIMNGQLQSNTPIGFGGNTETSAVVRGRMEGVPTGGAAPVKFTKFEKTPQQIITERERLLDAARKAGFTKPDDYIAYLKKLDTKLYNTVKQSFDEFNKLYPNEKAAKAGAIDTLYKKGTDMKSRLEKEFGKQTAKKAEQAAMAKAPNMLSKAANVGGKVVKGAGYVGGALPVLGAVNTMAQNWNTEGSTPQTRFMDAMGVIGDLGGLVAGGAVGHPIIGSMIGDVSGEAARRQAQIARDANRPYESYLSEQQNQGVQVPPAEATGSVGISDNAGDSSSQPVDLPTPPSPADYDANPPVTNLETFVVNNSDPNANYTGQAVSNGLTPINNIESTTAQQVAQPTYQVDPMLLDRINYYSNMSPSIGNVQSGQSTGQAAPIPPTIRDGNGQPLTITPSQQPVQVVDPATQMALDVARNQGYVTQQDIYNNLQKYNQIQAQAIANNPYYSGDAVRANTPFSIDEQELARLQRQDQLYANINAMTGRNLNTDSAQRYLNNAQQLYQAQIANQVGVPYSDYTTGVTERNKQMIEAAAKQRENELTFQLNQTNDMAKKLELYKEIQKNRSAMEQAIRTENIKGSYDLMKAGVTGGYGLAQEQTKGQYDLIKAQMDNRTKIQERLLQNQGALEVAKNNNLTEIQKQQLILSDPNKTIKGASDFMIALGYLNPTQQEAWIRSLSPAVQVRIFGRQLTPQEMTAIFRFAQQAGGGTNGIIAALERFRGIPSSYGNNGQ